MLEEALTEFTSYNTMLKAGDPPGKRSMKNGPAFKSMSSGK